MPPDSSRPSKQTPPLVGESASPSSRHGEDLLRLERVGLSYAGNPRFSLEEIDFTLRKGEWVVWVGPNGSGKSTLLKTLLGLIRPARGRLWKRQPAPRCGYVPQSSPIDPAWPLTVDNLLDLTLDLQAPPSFFRHRDPTRKAMVLRRVGIEGLRRQWLSSLSGGELQRVLLARTLLWEPEILLLDEPTASMDLVASEAFLDLIAGLQGEQGLTILMITHDFHCIRNRADRVGLIAGRRLHCGPVATMLTTEGLSRAFGIPVEMVPGSRTPRATSGATPWGERQGQE